MLDVLAIGSSILDYFLLSDEFKVVRDKHFTQRAGFPEHVAECFALGSKVSIKSVVLQSGGGATNAAATFVRQGLRTLLYTRLDRSGVGALIAEDFKRYKLPLRIRAAEGAAGVTAFLLMPDGSETALVHRGERSGLTYEDVRATESIATRWVYLSPGQTPLAVTTRLCETLKRRGVRIAVNPSNTLLSLGLFKLKRMLRATSVLFLNRQEAAELTTLPYENEKRILEVLGEASGGLVVMTEGQKGVVVSDGTHRHRAGIFPNKEVVNRTGAGDAFASGFLAALIRSETADRTGAPFRPSARAIAEAIRVGTANATSVVEHFGAKTGTLTKRDIARPRWKRLPVSVSQL